MPVLLGIVGLVLNMGRAVVREGQHQHALAVTLVDVYLHGSKGDKHTELHTHQHPEMQALPPTHVLHSVNRPALCGTHFSITSHPAVSQQPGAAEQEAAAVTDLQAQVAALQQQLEQKNAAIKAVIDKLRHLADAFNMWESHKKHLRQHAVQYAAAGAGSMV